jgi:hypothetical protein
MATVIATLWTVAWSRDLQDQAANRCTGATNPNWIRQVPSADH